MTDDLADKLEDYATENLIAGGLVPHAYTASCDCGQSLGRAFPWLIYAQQWSGRHLRRVRRPHVVTITDNGVTMLRHESRTRMDKLDDVPPF